MASHKDLTGADLHEPKGASSASVDTVYVSDGAGSGTWKKIADTSIATGSFGYVTTTALDLLVRSGVGTPEGAVTANVGTLYLRTDGGAGTTLYVKETGTGTTGWVGK